MIVCAGLGLFYMDLNRDFVFKWGLWYFNGRHLSWEIRSWSRARKRWKRLILSSAPRWGRWFRSWTRRNRRLLRGKMLVAPFLKRKCEGWFIRFTVGGVYSGMREPSSSTEMMWFSMFVQNSLRNTRLTLSSLLPSINSTSSSWSKWIVPKNIYQIIFISFLFSLQVFYWSVLSTILILLLMVQVV